MKEQTCKETHGRWIYQFRDSENEEWKCSECGCPTGKKLTYCPHCGAKMDKGETP